MIVDHDHETGAPLISFEDARRRALERIRPLPPADLPLREAFGCALASDLSAPSDLPSFASSAMDGYAVRAADTAGAHAGRPVTLRIAGRVHMGRPPEVDVSPGGAVAVPTGGAVPPGADAVVPVEHCAVEGDRLLVLRSTEPGRHVRPAGEDVRAGDLLVPAGRRLGPGDLGLLASVGIPVVPVRPRARVGILSTGDELVEPGDARGEAAIYDANTFTLDAASREAGAVPVPLGRVGDDPVDLARTLTEAAAGVDALVSSGGVSVGEHDPVRAAFAGAVDFVEVAMQPGKPQAFGSVGGRPYFGLPGNPVSVFVSFEVFVRPALRRMMGLPEGRPTVTATLAGEVSGPVEKVRFSRVRVDRDGERWRAVPTGGGRSNLLGTVSRANGLAMIPAGVERLVAGDAVQVLMFRDPEDR